MMTDTQVGMINAYEEGAEASVSMASSGPHDAEAVFACKFPPVSDEMSWESIMLLLLTLRA